MNKLFTKVATLSIGLALAIGVGVAVGSKAPAKVEATDLVFDLIPDSNMTVITNDDGLSVGTGNLKWTCNKDKAATVPAINTSNDELRLYATTQAAAEADKGKGGYIQFTWTGVEIKQVVVTVVNDSAVKYTIGSGSATAATITTVSNVKTITITGLSSAASLKIQNADLSGGQVRIKNFAFTYVSSEVPVTITGAATVDDDATVTYSCNSGVSATWTLTNVEPAGCATIVDNGNNTATVTAIHNGTATIVCTPSTSGYISNTKDLTITAAISHYNLAAGTYFIAAAAEVPGRNVTGMLVPEAGSDPKAAVISYADDSNAWTFEANNTADNAFNIKHGDLYLVSSATNNGVSITETAPAATNYWKVTKNGTDSFGNIQYYLSYSTSGGRTLALYKPNEGDNSFRNYISGTNLNMNLIPISTERTLTDLVTSGTLTTTNYAVGDSFAPDGTASVKATYTNNNGGSDNVYIDVTSTTGWNPATFTAAKESEKVYAKIGNIQSSTYFTVDVADSRVDVTGVTLDKASHTFTFAQIGTTMTLVATVAPENATDKTVAWTSSNPTVASVNGGGVVTANAVGSATITVTTNDQGKTATCSITVSDHVGTHTLITSTDELWEGRSIVIAAANYDYTMPHWSSGNYIAGAAATKSASKTSLTPGSSDSWIVGVYGDYYTFSYVSENVTYYLHQNTGSKNSPYLHVVAADDFDENCLFSVSYTDGQVSIKAYSQISDTDYFLKFNGGVTPTRFALYTGVTPVALYAVAAEETIYQYVDTFQNKHLHMKDYDPELHVGDEGDRDCLGNDGYYVKAKAALIALDAAHSGCIDYLRHQGAYSEVADAFANARARYEAWGLACGDTSYYSGSGIIPATRIMLDGFNDAGSTIIIVITSTLVGVAAIGGYFLFKKKER